MAASAPLEIGARPPAGRRWLAPVAARALQAGWLALQIGALALAIAATPALHASYQTQCADQLCDALPQPNADTLRQLARLGVSVRDYAAVMVAVEWVLMLIWGALGALIVVKRPRDPVGLLLAYGGVVAANTAFLNALRAEQPEVTRPAQVGLVVTTVALPLIVALFPDGRWVPRWSRWVALAAIGYGLAVAFSGPPTPRLLAVLDLPLGVGPLVCLLGAQVYRYRRVSNAVQRQQTKWLLFGLGLLVANVALASAAYVFDQAARFQFPFLAVCYGSFLAIGVAVSFAILRYRLFDIDAILNRAMVYGGLTAGVVGLYALVVGALGTLVRSGGEPAITFVATGIVAVLFAPLRDRLQRATNRLLYGQRDEPYAVVAGLGRRLEASLAPEAVLPTIVETVASALKLPYAAIALRQEEVATVAADQGVVPPQPPLVVPLVYRGEHVGELRLAPRAGERTLSTADRRLVDDLAPQAGAAVHAVRLMHDLRRAHERLVAAREEERRRLRRDLHDGLGPQLASQALTIDAARALMVTDAAAADALLVDLKEQGRAAVADVRRLVYNLRPPALDNLGLVAALRQEAVPCGRAGLRVTIAAPEPLPPLPAAVEMAAYRIAQEALTNAARHAGARSCIVGLALDDHGRTLALEIADDGRGLGTEHRAGVGTASMRERAEELGGLCVVEGRPGGGTLVRARLPLPREG